MHKRWKELVKLIVATTEYIMIIMSNRRNSMECMAFCFLVIFTILSCMDAYKIAPSLDHQCPPWTSPQNGSCKCGNDLKGIVKCENGKGAFAVKNCFCMTTLENSYSVIVGICPYTCIIIISMTHLTKQKILIMKRVGLIKKEGNCVENASKAMACLLTPTTYHVWSAQTTSITGSST